MARYMRGMTNGGSISAHGNEPLTNEMLRAAVPSIFATEAHSSRSDRFVAIPTVNVLDGLRNEGFEPFFAQQSRSRIAGKQEFTKHLLRLRHRGLTNANGDSFEIILVNANDGTAAYHMLPGFFRFVCANGLFTGETFKETKVRHSGNAVNEVIEGAYSVLNEAPQIAAQVDAFQHTRLSRDESMAFAEAAHVLRFPAVHAEVEEGEEPKAAPVDALRLLSARRYEDQAIRDTLWGTFNVVQENVIKGGQRGMVQGANGPRRASTREVAGIDQNRALNRALWTLTERMAELKAVA